MQYQRLFFYFNKFKWTFLIGIVFVIIATLTRNYTPRLVQKLIDTILTNLENNNASDALMEPLVLKFIIYYIGLTLISAIFTFLMRQTIIVASRKIEYDLKNESYKHIQNLNINEFKKYTVGDLMSRLGEDIGKIREVFGPALMYLITLITTLIFTIYFMYSVSPIMTFWALLPLPFLSFFVYAYNSYAYKYNKILQQNLSSLTSIAQESYNGIRIIKSFTLEEKILAQFAAMSEKYKFQNLKIVKIESLFMPTSVFLMSLSILLTIYKGGQLYFEDPKAFTLGNLTEFIMYVQNLTWPIMSIGWVANLFQRGKAALTRYDEIMNLEEETKFGIELNIHSQNGSIKFDQVSYTYPDTGIKAIDNVSFEIPIGQRWLIIGKTGSGKSTLAELLMKFYSNYEGAISINEKEIRNLISSELRSYISYIPQDVFLFSDTIRNNIAFADNDFSNELITQSAKDAQIHQEITKFQHGYETIVGERGITLSGGQKQRISIARALVKPSPIYLFDDCLSAVDVETEKNLIEAINSKNKDNTLIMITHRIFNQLKFDKIMVLTEGKIEELGSHEELMDKKGYYFELYKKQEFKNQLVEEKIIN